MTETSCKQPKTRINRQRTTAKEVIVCQAGNAQIAGTPLKRMPTPMSAHRARKSVNFLIIPAIHRIVPMKVPIVESANRRADFLPSYSLRAIPNMRAEYHPKGELSVICYSLLVNSKKGMKSFYISHPLWIYIMRLSSNSNNN